MPRAFPRLPLVRALVGSSLSLSLARVARARRALLSEKDVDSTHNSTIVCS